MRRRSLLPISAAGVAAVVGLSAVPASAATATPARGSASSSLSLLDVSVAGKLIKTVNAVGSTSTLTGKLAQLAITPVLIGTTEYGKQTITPSSGSKTISAPSAPALPGNLAQLVSPVLTASASLAKAGPFTALGATSLGSAKVLNLPLALTGALSQTAVTGPSAIGHTGLELTNFALPSLTDLLGALGLDINALPVATLDNLLTQLALPTAGLSAANSAVAAAQTAAHSTIDRLRNATALVTSRQGVLATAQAQLTTATNQLNTLLSGLTGGMLTTLGLGSIPTAAAFDALSGVTKTLANTLVSGLSAADAAFAAANNLVNLAAGAVTTATGLVTSLTNLGDLVKSVLNGVPLASLSGIDLSATSSAGKALSAGVTGTVTGLKVLGTDVLKAVTGSSSIDAVKLVGTTLNQVQGVANNMLTSLQGILSAVPGVSGIHFPLPTVKVMDVVKSAKRFTNGSQDAMATVSALSIDIPAIQLPSAIALPSITGLPGLSAITGALKSSALHIGVGNVVEHSVFLPAGVTKVGTIVNTAQSTPSTSSLASTGSNPLIAFAALMAMALGVAIRRISKASGSAARF